MMRARRVWLSLWVVGLASCASDDAVTSIEQALGGTAAISLTSSSTRITHTTDTQWTLDKLGQLDPATQTVTWTVTATKGTTTTDQLIVNGTLTVKNVGSGGATIGNIVVNLQGRHNNTWVSRAVDIADATQDDAATFARIVPSASSEKRSTFTESSASGRLVFTDKATNSVFSLVPQVIIPGGATRTLLYSATFDNSVLGLAPGTPVRVETIVSFGNAGLGGSAQNIDINGNGIVDPDEARVRSVVTRHGLVIPAKKPSNTTPTLTDTLADITTTGTVTFGNPTFHLGPTSGTVTVTYDGGAEGGTITNCAHLRSQTSTVSCGGHTFPTVLGIDLTSCDTQTIGPHTCTPGTAGCGWESGDVVTFTQVAWGTSGSPAAMLLSSRFFSIYTAGLVEIGIPGAAGFSAVFTAPSSIVTYLPASGPLGPLTNDLIDPSSTSSGAFGGEVLALTLNVDFSALTGGTAGIPLSSLRICGVTPSALSGTTVASFLALANTLLGGGTSGVSIDQVTPIAAQINSAFTGGAPSTWAQDHLVHGPCP
jgi:hypothetical protein